MLVSLRQNEFLKLIPAVATGNQFKNALGSPQKVLQRLMISSIGGVITLLISQSQIASQFYSFWLIIGVTFLLYILWGPIVEAGNRNAKLRKYPFAALFDGFISNIYTEERIESRQEQANRKGKLELIESRRLWIFCELEDEDGYLSKISFPMEKEHQVLKSGLRIMCLVLSNDKRFNSQLTLSDAWVPSRRLWLGEYPFLLRPAFQELCNMRLR